MGAYSIAIEELESEEWRQDLIRFRGDHQRHIGDISRLIRNLGGEPMMMPHVPTGAFKSAVQAAGAVGGDREVLLAFKANEGQVRDKYHRAARADHPAEVAGLLRRNAGDEEVHYSWVSEALEGLGAGPGSPVGKAEAGFERVLGGAADAMERAERGAMRGAEKLRRTLPGGGLGTLLLAGLAVLILRKLSK